ncbi:MULTISPECIES: hypothetical protein [Cohnella]|uniref:hypothetical protein n=1 Tax=Cohnella TaxID=329857 RepID=UPI00111938BF|nr:MULTISPECIES: hypothetical protein [Cohnella]MBN2981434.1 hypothetical protein [Cohnella algarum]
MRSIIREGWSLTSRHKYVLVALFLYRLLWGFFLYRFIDSVVTPILARYPDGHPNGNAVRLFLIEAQFRLTKTDLMNEALLMLAGMLLLRMVLTPLLNAGLYYSFHHADEERGTRMLTGMRRAWKPVVLLYLLENALAFLPALWLLPFAKSQFLAQFSVESWALKMLPYAAVWMCWIFIVHLLFQFMQFGAVSKDGIVKGLARACAKALPLAAVTLLLTGIGAAASVAVTGATMFWTGFISVAVHQAFQFVRTMMAVWTSASQYALWKADSAA